MGTPFHQDWQGQAPASPASQEPRMGGSRANMFLDMGPDPRLQSVMGQLRPDYRQYAHGSPEMFPPQGRAPQLQPAQGQRPQGTVQPAPAGQPQRLRFMSPAAEEEYRRIKQAGPSPWWDPSQPFDAYKYLQAQYEYDPVKYGGYTRNNQLPAPQAAQMTERVASPRLQDLLGANQAATEFPLMRRGAYG